MHFPAQHKSDNQVDRWFKNNIENLGPSPGNLSDLPDLDPIKNLWSSYKKRVGKQKVERNFDQLQSTDYT